MLQGYAHASSLVHHGVGLIGMEPENSEEARRNEYTRNINSDGHTLIVFIHHITYLSRNSALVLLRSDQRGLIKHVWRRTDSSQHQLSICVLHIYLLNSVYW